MYNTQVEPERILEFSVQDGLSCYKVRWHDSWVAQESLSHSWQHLIDQYWKTQQSEATNSQVKFSNRFLPNFASMLSLNSYTQHPLSNPHPNNFMNHGNEASLNHFHHLTTPIHHQPDRHTHPPINQSTIPDVSQNNASALLSGHLFNRPSAHLNTNLAVESTLPDFNIAATPIPTNIDVCVDVDKQKTSKSITNQRHVVAKKLLNSAKSRVVRKTKQKTDDQKLDDQTKDGVTCSVCQRDFSKTSKPRKRLREHFRRMHLKNGKFKCSVCSKSFVCQQGLRDHEPVHSKERNFSCRYCNQTFLRLSHLYVHLRTHEEEKNFRCEACFQTFAVQSELKEHCTTAHANITADMTCGVCKQNLYSSASVYSHSLRHSGPRDFKCDVCGAAFKRKQILEQHLKRHEQENETNKTFECRICKKAFENELLLREHASTVHQTTLEETNHKCNICEKSFRNWANYRRHVLLHTKTSQDDTIKTAKIQEKQIREKYDEDSEEEHDFTCNVCQEVFTYVKTILEHLQQHSNSNEEKHSNSNEDQEKEIDNGHVISSNRLSAKADNLLQDISCPVCQKTFTKQKYLKSHMDIHSGVELKCDVCGMLFKRRDTLRIHRKRHAIRNENKQNYQGRTGEIYNNRKELRDKIGAPDKDGNISCPYCEKVFSKRKLLLAHIVLHGNVFYSCDICGKSYKQKSCLNKHTKSHTTFNEDEQKDDGEKNKEISKGKESKNTSSSVREKAFRCGICKRSYAYKKRLIEHLKIHKNEVEVSESNTQILEVSESNRQIHDVSESSNEATHECSICHETFRREESLIRHLKLHHSTQCINDIKKSCAEPQVEKLDEDVNDKVVDILKTSLLKSHHNNDEGTFRIAETSNDELEASVKSFHQNIIRNGDKRNSSTEPKVLFVVMDKTKK